MHCLQAMQVVLPFHFERTCLLCLFKTSQQILGITLTKYLRKSLQLLLSLKE